MKINRIELDTYWYEYTKDVAFHNLDFCLATNDPCKYCNGYYKYSSKDPGDGLEYVILRSNDPNLHKINYIYDFAVTKLELLKQTPIFNYNLINDDEIQKIRMNKHNNVQWESLWKLENHNYYQKTVYGGNSSLGQDWGNPLTYEEALITMIRELKQMQL